MNGLAKQRNGGEAPGKAMEEPCGDRNSAVCKGIEELGGAMRRKREAMSGKGMAKNREDKQWQGEATTSLAQNGNGKAKSDGKARL